MSPADYCPATDAARSYDVAIAAIREQLVREHKVLPCPGDPTEQQWSREGTATDRPEGKP